MIMHDVSNIWVVFGINKSKEIISEILGNRIAFFISYDKDNPIYRNANNIYSLDEVKNSLADKKILLGYYDPEIEIDMRELLKDTDAKEIHSFCDIIRLDEYVAYDYTVILDTIWKHGLYKEFEFQLNSWRCFAKPFLISPIDDIFRKHHMVEKKRLIDVACGYGFWSRYFCKKGFQVGAIDNDISRLKVLETINSIEKLDILIQESDIRNMEGILDNSYGVSCCFNTIHVIPNWRKVMPEILRITEAEGYCVLVVTNLDNFRLKYKYLVHIQWDATRDSIISELKPKARLIDETEVYSRAGDRHNLPSHYILIFQKEV